MRKQMQRAAHVTRSKDMHAQSDHTNTRVTMERTLPRLEAKQHSYVVAYVGVLYYPDEALRRSHRSMPMHLPGEKKTVATCVSRCTERQMRPGTKT